MSERETSSLRVLDIVLGLIIVVLSIVIVVYPRPVTLTLAYIPSIALLLMGIARVVTGIFAKYLSYWLRAINLGTGMIVVVMTFLATFHPKFTIQMVIYLFSLALLLHGTTTVVMGGFAKVFPTSLRGLLVVVGLLTILLSVVVFMSTESGFLIRYLIISFALMLNGIARIVLGITHM